MVKFTTSKEEALLARIESLRSESASRATELSDALRITNEDYALYKSECSPFFGFGAVNLSSLQDAALHIANVAHVLPDFSYAQLRQLLVPYAEERRIKLTTDPVNLFTLLAELAPSLGEKLAPAVSVLIRVLICSTNYFNGRIDALTKSLERVPSDLEEEVAKVNAELLAYRSSIEYALEIKDVEINYWRSLATKASSK